MITEESTVKELFLKCVESMKANESVTVILPVCSPDGDTSYFALTYIGGEEEVRALGVGAPASHGDVRVSDRKALN